MNRSALITALVITQCILGQVGLASTFSTQRTSASKAQDSLLEQTYSNRFDVFYGLQEAYLKQMALKIIDQNGGQEPMQVRYQRPDRFDWRSFVIATLPGSNRRIWVSSTDKYIQEPDRVRRQVGREYLFSPMTIQDLFQRVDGMVTTEQPIPEDPSDEVRLYARIVFDHFVRSCPSPS